MFTLVFGGTFNPPHLGHQLMVEQVLGQTLPDGRLVDQLWLLPVGKHSFDKEFVAAEHRLAMLELLRQDVVARHDQTWLNKIRLEDYEIHQPQASQTFATLEHLAAAHPAHKLAFLIGSDNLVNFHLWHDFELLLHKYPFYVYPRTGYPMTPLRPGMIALTGFPESKVSSTAVRQAFSQQQDLSPLLNQRIINYLREQQLYGIS